MIIAARQGVNQRREAWEEPPLDLIEPLLIDREPYLRKNLGPYAIGDRLLRCHPEPTLDRLRHWGNDSREQVGWNVAMAFHSYRGTRHLNEAKDILDELAADQRRFVWRAAASSLLYLGRRYPQIVRPTLEEWLQDELQVPAAKTDLGYLKTPQDKIPWLSGSFPQ